MSRKLDPLGSRAKLIYTPIIVSRSWTEGCCKLSSWLLLSYNNSKLKRLCSILQVADVHIVRYVAREEPAISFIAELATVNLELKIQKNKI